MANNNLIKKISMPTATVTLLHCIENAAMKSLTNSDKDRLSGYVSVADPSNYHRFNS